MKIILSPRAAKQYKRISPIDKSKVDRKIEYLANNPLAGKALQGEFKGEYTLRAWPLRIIYIFRPNEQIIMIEDIDYRGNVYKN